MGPEGLLRRKASWKRFADIFAELAVIFPTMGEISQSVRNRRNISTKLISKATDKQHTNYLQSDPSGLPPVPMVPFSNRKWGTAVNDVC
jgi:hypothetical protein